MIYCVSSGGLFHVNKLDNTINRMSKITGLSDINITKVAYSNNLKMPSYYNPSMPVSYTAPTASTCAVY